MILHFTANIWVYAGKGGWHFVTLPPDLAAQIRFFGPKGAGRWKSVPVTVLVGASQWRTSIFPDRASNSFVLPIKADIRKAEDIVAGQEVAVELTLQGSDAVFLEC